MKPKVVHFQPYVGSQLAAIIKERDVGKIFSPMAVTYCAKVAADRGDVRRALDMCRLVEAVCVWVGRGRGSWYRIGMMCLWFSWS